MRCGGCHDPARIHTFTHQGAVIEQPVRAKYHLQSLYGDISAITQMNRAGPPLGYIVEREDWHTRLVNGSNYPLPGIIPRFSGDALTEQGMMDARMAPDSRAIRDHNPLLFDFVRKRHLRSGGQRLADAVFHTRDCFLPASPTETRGGPA